MLEIPLWRLAILLYLAWNCGFLGATVYQKMADPSWPKRWRAAWWELALAGFAVLILPIGEYLLLDRVVRHVVGRFRMRRAASARRKAVRHA